VSHVPAPITDSSRVACVYCGYDLTGTAVGGRCPECGARVSESLRRSPGASNSALATDSTPIVCLVFGILSLVTSCFPLGIVAIIMYGRARRAIATGQAPADQATLATVGLVLGWVSIGIALLLMLFMAAPCFLGIIAAVLNP